MDQRDALNGHLRDIPRQMSDTVREATGLVRVEPVFPPVPPVRRAAGDEKLTQPGRYGHQISYKGGTPGTPGGARPAPNVIGTNAARPLDSSPHNGLALDAQAAEKFIDGNYTDAIVRPGSPGSAALRKIEDLHKNMLPPASAKSGMQPPTAAEIRLAQQHAKQTGCSQCHAFLVGLHRGAAGGRQQAQEQQRAQQRRSSSQRR